MNDTASPPNILPDGYSRLNVTYLGQNGDLPDPILNDMNHDDVIRMTEEAIRTGGIPGIPADPNVRLADFVVDKPFPPTESRPYWLRTVRPKTAYGT